ncbi:Protein boule-like, partial [Sciurus carolinensis]|nr:Protein boule-like [Sciurus carolinensis]
TSNQTQTDSLSPSPNPVSPVPLNNPTSAPRYGTVIPNRIFVGGIDFKTNENDLRKFFSQYGSVKEVKIVNDRAGVSKGYGFVTFETQEDAQKILQEAPAQCLPGQWQWGVPQSPASSTPFLYLQPSEVIYQPVEIAQDGGCVPPPLSLMEASVPEPYSDHGVQATYHQVYAPSAIAMPAPVMQPEPIKVRSLF